MDKTGIVLFHEVNPPAQAVIGELRPYLPTKMNNPGQPVGRIPLKGAHPIVGQIAIGIVGKPSLSSKASRFISLLSAIWELR